MGRHFTSVAVLGIVVSMLPVPSRAVAGYQLACRFKGVMSFGSVYADSRAGGGLLAISGTGTLPGTCVALGLKPKVEPAIADFNLNRQLGVDIFAGGWVVFPDAHTVPSPDGIVCGTSGALSLLTLVRTKSGNFYVGLDSVGDWPGINGETALEGGAPSAGLWSQSIFGACPPTDGQSVVSLAFVEAVARPASGA